MPATSIAGFASLPERVRAFIALRLDAAVEEAIAGADRAFAHARKRYRTDGIRWVRRANFHLTLFFLGPAVPRERLAPIAEALGAIAKRPRLLKSRRVAWASFRISARPRVIWVGLHGDALAALAARVAEAAERCGFTPERRAYSPHLTIGRVRSLRSPGRLRRALSEAADSSFGVSRIERVMLYRSELGPQSSTYHELAAFPLGVRERG